jgi:4-coumarate--CoA ligase
MRRFDLEPCLSYIEKYKLTEAGFVPPIFVAIVMSGLGKKYSLKSLKMVTSGAAPLGRDTQARMQEYLSKDARVLQVWGMTETSCIASQFEYPEGDDTGSVGRMLPDLDVKYDIRKPFEILRTDQTL